MSGSIDPTSEETTDPSVLVSQLLRCGRGDESALADFYDLTAPRAWALVRQVVSDRVGAERVLLEAYLRLWREARGFDPAHEGAENRLLAAVHREAVARVRSAPAFMQDRATLIERSKWMRDAAVRSDPCPPMSRARRVKDGEAPLKRLRRQAVELAYWGGYTHDEVAQIMGIPVEYASTLMRDELIDRAGTIDSGHER